MSIYIYILYKNGSVTFKVFMLLLSHIIDHVIILFLILFFIIFFIPILIYKY